jgi:hypothetical protein
VALPHLLAISNHFEAKAPLEDLDEQPHNCLGPTVRENHHSRIRTEAGTNEPQKLLERKCPKTKEKSLLRAEKQKNHPTHEAGLQESPHQALKHKGPSLSEEREKRPSLPQLLWQAPAAKKRQKLSGPARRHLFFAKVREEQEEKMRLWV